jgi:hypothetical protein
MICCWSWLNSLARALIAHAGHHVLGENVAAQQKGVIGFERIKRLLQ